MMEREAEDVDVVEAGVAEGEVEEDLETVVVLAVVETLLKLVDLVVENQVVVLEAVEDLVPRHQVMKTLVDLVVEETLVTVKVVVEVVAEVEVVPVHPEELVTDATKKGILFEIVLTLHLITMLRLLPKVDSVVDLVVVKVRLVLVVDL